jgi:hypothetical protein
MDRVGVENSDPTGFAYYRARVILRDRRLRPETHRCPPSRCGAQTNTTPSASRATGPGATAPAPCTTRSALARRAPRETVEPLTRGAEIVPQWPRGGPAKGRETSSSEGLLKRRRCAGQDPNWGVFAGQRILLKRIPKPRVAGSIPAGGTTSTSANALPGVSRRALLWPGRGERYPNSVSAASAAARPSGGITAE